MPLLSISVARLPPDPIEQIEVNLGKLKQKSISIVVKRNNVLKNDKSTIQNIIENYYNKLLRTQNSELCWTRLI